MAKKYYTVASVQKKATIGIPAYMGLDGKPTRWEQDIDFSGLGNGVVGVMPVFTNKKKAHKFAGKKFQVIMFERSEG